MPLVMYGPDGTTTAGNSQIGIVDAIADLNSPTALELANATVIQCALEEFGSTTEVSYRTRKKLCHKKGQQRVGERNYGTITLTITLDDPQGAAQAATDKLAEDNEVFIYHRPGKDDTELPVAGDKVQTLRGFVASNDLAPITNEDGAEYEAIIQIAVVERNTGLLVPVV